MIVKNRKGISTFIATLLLMVLAVAAGIVIYAYTMGYLGGVGSPTTMGAMSLDSVKMTVTGTPTVTAYLRNIGKVGLEPATAYVNNVLVTGAITFTVPTGVTYPTGTPPNTIPENYIGQISFTPPTGITYTAGVTYSIKVICKDNTQLSFDVKATA